MLQQIAESIEINMKHYSFLLIILVAMVPSFAQADQPNVWTEDVPTTSLQYKSFLGDYQSYRDAKVGSWKAQNAAATDGMDDGMKEDKNPMDQPVKPAEAPSPHAGHHMDHKE
ncbi:hypothetical protein [Novimethylophilus kurashikiensis]|uniref:hypothetical protein n=1 Tax=Novimethylophilus kurashikiensis TaxID=1825523 RepID=UPI0011B26D6B|nr:hypothetical protein [Novimethylophilus kurashikiensis]